MNEKLKIALAQLNPLVGGVSGNVDKLLKVRSELNNDVDLSSTLIKKVMTKKFKFIDETDYVLDVSRVMENQKIYSLIVKDSKNKITGLIRMHEILSAKII